MKILITFIVALIIGFVAGWYFEHRHAEREMSDVIEQMHQPVESSDGEKAAKAIANGRMVWLAVISSDNPSKTNIQKLVGLQVAFSGGAAYGGTKLFVNSNIVIEVEMRPSQDVWRNVGQAVSFGVDVLGILESVDFEKRVIHIQAKPEDWRITGAD
jgi:hypothetical protein